MLAPDGRAVLLDALRPPEGFALGYAVATTFTLDLTAALVVPMAFATSQLGDSRDPVAVMEAVRASADRVSVFCQAGNIAVPHQASDLVAFIEPMVHEVHRPRPGHLFHPKLWALRFDAEDGASHYRVLVLTRNLTLDRGWDLVLRLDDDPNVTRRHRDNDQLVRLLEALPGMAIEPLPPNRADAVAALAEELRYVSWEAPDGVNEVRFWSFGIGRLARPDLSSGYRHLVVTPFVTEGGLAPVVEASPEVHLVSRSEELDRLDPKTFEDVEVYALDPLVGYGDAGEAGPLAPERESSDDPPEAGAAITDATSPPSLRELHAKLYIAERSKRAHVFIGSANATDAAFGGNVEVLCELVGGHSKLGVAAVLDVANGIGTLLQPYVPNGSRIDDEIDQLERRLDEILRAAAEIALTATATGESDLWSVRLRSSTPLPTDASRFAIAPLNRPVEQNSIAPGKRVDVTFGPRLAADLTAFFVLTARLPDDPIPPRSTVVRATLVDAPDGRLDAIIARQVDTPEKFLRFLLLLLGAAPDGSPFDGSPGASGVGAGRWLAGSTGVLELLVTTLATRPHAIDDLAPLVERLQATDAGRAVLPAGWNDLWAAVVTARAQLGRQP